MKRAFFLRRVDMYLGLGLDTWNVLTLVFLGAKAIAAFGLLISQRAVIVLQDEVDKASREELERYKTQASKKISDANARGEEAKASAAEANARQKKLSSK